MRRIARDFHIFVLPKPCCLQQLSASAPGALALPAHTQTATPILRGVRMSGKLTVGQRVKVRPKVGPPQEGIVYTHDSITNTVTIKQGLHNTTTHNTIMVFNRSHVEIDVVPGVTMVDDVIALPNISDRELERKEQRNTAEAARAWAQINREASNEGQAIFDSFSKTLECEWLGESIVVLGSVKIDPPYTARDCRSLDGDQMGMDRAILMLGKFQKQVKQSS